MSIANKELTALALALPIQQRIELAQQLWESIGGPRPAMSEEEITQESLRRSAEIDAGDVECFSHEQVMRDARKAIGCD